MKLYLKDEEYVITDETIQGARNQIATFAEKQYNKLPDAAKLLMQAGVRALLQFAEKTEANPDRKKQIRPVRGTDPTIHLMNLLLNYIAEALPHAELQIATEENIINNITIKNPGEGG